MPSWDRASLIGRSTLQCVMLGPAWKRFTQEFHREVFLGHSCTPWTLPTCRSLPGSAAPGHLRRWHRHASVSSFTANCLQRIPGMVACNRKMDCQMECGHSLLKVSLCNFFPAARNLHRSDFRWKPYHQCHFALLLRSSSRSETDLEFSHHGGQI